MVGFVSGRRRVRVAGVAAAAVVAVAVAGCSPANGDGDAKAGAGPAVSSAAPVPVEPRVIGKEQAEKVFFDYGLAHSQAAAKADTDAIVKLETGALLEQSLARYARMKANSETTAGAATFVAPVFVLPTEREQPGYPRSFFVISKRQGAEGDRASALHYFVQAEPGGAWKAAARSWANVVPKGAGASSSDTYEEGVRLRAWQISEPQVEPAGAGAGVLSARAEADRTVCGRYAAYLSFTAPNGERMSPHFLPGGLTSHLVDARNERDKEVDGQVRHRFDYEVTFGDLPVVRLANGNSLVTCSFTRTEHLVGKESTTVFSFKKDGKIDDLLGGGERNWSVVDTRWSETAVFEVPEQGLADVVASNSRSAQLLSAEGTR